MEKAAYHKSLPLKYSSISNRKKSEVFSLLDEEGILFDRNVSCMEAKQVLKDWISSNVEPEIVALTKTGGQEILFTPPHHSDLQRIELL